mmetsp:Transcript_44732/g.50687  ORF Transcript_44732/g.50687 Transcript_44732/m.50687 type:complete len:184 (+) Transcript_44732:100-651(+)
MFEHNLEVIAVFTLDVRQKGRNQNGVDHLDPHDKHSGVTSNSLLRVENWNIQNEGKYHDMVHEDQHHDGLEVHPHRFSRKPFRNGVLETHVPALLNRHKQRCDLPQPVGNVVQDEGVVSLRCVNFPVGGVHKDQVKVEKKDELNGRHNLGGFFEVIESGVGLAHHAKIMHDHKGTDRDGMEHD